MGRRGISHRAALAAIAVSALSAAAPAQAAPTPAIAASSKGRLALLSPTTGIRVLVQASVHQPAWSPDGQRLAFASARDGNWEIYLFNVETNGVRRLTNSPTAVDEQPAWSPDGTQIAWTRTEGIAIDIWLASVNGKNARPLSTATGEDRDPAWTPGGAVAFSSDRGGSGFDLWSADATTGTATPLVQLPGDESDPAFAADGSGLAFTHTESGNTDVYAATASGASPQRLTTLAGTDAQPAWSPNAQSLAFVSARKGGRKIWVMSRDGAGQRALPSSRAGDGHPSWARAAVSRVLPLPDELLPDLDQRAPAALTVLHLAGRWRLGFGSAVDNVGEGPIWIHGSRPSTAVPTMRGDQVVKLRAGGRRVYRQVGVLRYQKHPPHHHWHFRPFARYELHREADFKLLVRDRKTGFCIADHYGFAAKRVKNFTGPHFLGNCGTGNPKQLRVNEGASPGFTDRYPAFFHGQDLDLTGLAAGRYMLVNRSNPDRKMKESRYDNNAASVLLRLTWPHGRANAPHIEVLARCEDSERCG
jgi:Tol biopolymer transport system component